jgi:hypothetical protein
MSNDKVRICISAYLNDSEKKINAAFSCVYSLLAQTYENYEIFIHHDGPVNDKTLPDKFRNLSDKIVFIDNLEHRGSWGFYHRHKVSMIEPHADWVLYTNEDNYYVPVFLERMMESARLTGSKMIHCDTLHSHFNYTVLHTTVVENRIDMGSFISHMDLVKITPWTDFHASADGVYAAKIGSQTNPIKANGILFVHN